jgi:hypothetical protein
MTPALFIPVVGNVLPALAGMVLGHPVWAAVQFGLAALLWPVAATPVALDLHHRGATFCIGFIGFEPRITILGGCRAVVRGCAVFMCISMGDPRAGQANIWHAFLGNVLSFGGILGFVVGLVRGARSDAALGMGCFGAGFCCDCLAFAVNFGGYLAGPIVGA